jgi:hypothetical protein
MWERNYGSIFLQCAGLSDSTIKQLTKDQCRALSLSELRGCPVAKVQDLVGGCPSADAFRMLQFVSLCDITALTVHVDKVNAQAEKSDLRIEITPTFSTNLSTTRLPSVDTFPTYQLVCYHVPSATLICHRRISKQQVYDLVSGRSLGRVDSQSRVSAAPTAPPIEIILRVKQGYPLHELKCILISSIVGMDFIASNLHTATNVQVQSKTSLPTGSLDHLLPIIAEDADVDDQQQPSRRGASKSKRKQTDSLGASTQAPKPKRNKPSQTGAVSASTPRDTSPLRMPEKSFQNTAVSPDGNIRRFMVPISTSPKMPLANSVPKCLPGQQNLLQSTTDATRSGQIRAGTSDEASTTKRMPCNLFQQLQRLDEDAKLQFQPSSTEHVNSLADTYKGPSNAVTVPSASDGGADANYARYGGDINAHESYSTSAKKMNEALPPPNITTAAATCSISSKIIEANVTTPALHARQLKCRPVTPSTSPTRGKGPFDAFAYDNHPQDTRAPSSVRPPSRMEEDSETTSGARSAHVNPGLALLRRKAFEHKLDTLPVTRLRTSPAKSPQSGYKVGALERLTTRPQEPIQDYRLQDFQKRRESGFGGISTNEWLASDLHDRRQLDQDPCSYYAALNGRSSAEDRYSAAVPLQTTPASYNGALSVRPTQAKAALATAYPAKDTWPRPYLPSERGRLMNTAAVRAYSPYDPMQQETLCGTSTATSEGWSRGYDDVPQSHRLNPATIPSFGPNFIVNDQWQRSPSLVPFPHTKCVPPSYSSLARTKDDAEEVMERSAIDLFDAGFF